MSSPVFHYSVYGARIHSDTAFPELDPTAVDQYGRGASINVRLRDGNLNVPVAPCWFLPAGLYGNHDQVLCGKMENGYLLRFAGLADFLISAGGCELRCSHLESTTSPRTLRHLLLDRVLPMVLNLLGHEAIHATAVDTPNGICAFIGPAGAGKSTLAGSFAAAGYTPFCDDCLVIRTGGDIICIPGYPGVRLWSDSLNAILDDSVRIEDMGGGNSKSRIVNRAGRLPPTPRPLIAIFRISRMATGEQAVSSVRLDRLTRREAFMELVSSAYVFDVTEPAALLRHFHFIEQVVAGVPVARLLLPNDFTFLSAARSAILNDLQDLWEQRRHQTCG